MQDVAKAYADKAQSDDGTDAGMCGVFGGIGGGTAACRGKRLAGSGTAVGDSPGAAPPVDSGCDGRDSGGVKPGRVAWCQLSTPAATV